MGPLRPIAFFILGRLLPIEFDFLPNVQAVVLGQNAAHVEKHARAYVSVPIIITWRYFY
ncbi:hypothetical protein D9M72_463990 [compost metagenome]